VWTACSSGGNSTGAPASSDAGTESEAAPNVDGGSIPDVVVSGDSGPIVDATSGDADGGISTGGCVMTITGANTASGPCNLSLGYSAAQGHLAFGVTLMAKPTDSFGCDLATSPTLTAGVFTQANGRDYVSTVLDVSKVWQALYENGGDPATGTYTLTITDPGTPASSGADTFYPYAHGTLDATLPPVTATGATGDTMIHVTF
jgi:hypothetical protein